MNNTELEKIAKSVRKEIFKFKTRTGNGHLASCLSPVEVVVSLYYDSKTTFDHKKDILIFSKAHGSPVVYPILADLGYYDKDELNKYCTPEGILRLHSDQSIPGCHFVGGSLGNGIGYAAGVAMGNPHVDVYVILGDAELYEGSVWETMMFITHHKLTNIKLIIDRNQLGILGATEELLKLEPLGDKFKSFGFDTYTIDGHNYDELRTHLNKKGDTPVAIIANTIKGKGVSYMEGKYEYHTIIPKNEQDINTGLSELS
jgi:transketolase